MVGIIGLLAVMTLPAVSRMWEDSRRADTDNKLRGLLMSARSRALNTTPHGLFFYLENDVQKAVFIEADPADPTSQDDEAGGVTIQDTNDRFRVVMDAKVYEFPAPFRVMPREVLDQTAPPAYDWSDAELTNNDYTVLTTDAPPNGAHNHRNFFTVLFSKSGGLVMRNVVLIHDGPATAVIGEITGLAVKNLTDYQVNTDASAPPASQFPSGATLPGMVYTTVGSTDVAINFPSVDGFLIYDDAVFADFLDAGSGARDYLIRDAQPIYISRQTGATVRGPRGESEPPPP